ncbi:MAG: Asp-tRNA(Asn)/Glu-tRNA(Gln) amidotransferase subunit GatB [Bacilli bacterium]|nr:Asp-tRNA(Asn)/Glu-tRNA(Gln) amidotransferase subunit GatB [Bacilli bacterium]
MNNYKKTIGIEVHVELKTKEKLFSPSSNLYGNMANQNANIIDLGYPGVLPTLNKEAIDLAIKAAHVLNCKIRKNMHFDRKNYFYPDNPKNFQITQARTPIGYDGYVEIDDDGIKKRIEILEMHIEEDTSKSIHSKERTLLDFNRAGVPLIEIVTKPCIHTSKEATLYLEKLRELLLYAGVSDCKIEEGSMRCDANISISTSDTLGTKIEVKNIGSITNVGLAIDHEGIRQEELIENGTSLKEETRRYDAKLDKTILMRVKETGNDYRYFPEPDIPYINLSDEYIENVLSDLPTSAEVRRNKYLESGISLINVNKLIANKELSDYLETFSDINLKTASNLLLGDIQAYLNKKNISIFATKLTNAKMLELVNKLDDGSISHKNFKDLVDDIMDTDTNIQELLKEKGIENVVDDTLVLDIINKVLTENEKVVDDYLGGNERSLKFLMGMVMKESKGSVNPKLANDLLIKTLNERKN